MNLYTYRCKNRLPASAGTDNSGLVMNFTHFEDLILELWKPLWGICNKMRTTNDTTISINATRHNYLVLDCTYSDYGRLPKLWWGNVITVRSAIARLQKTSSVFSVLLQHFQIYIGPCVHGHEHFKLDFRTCDPNLRVVYCTRKSTQGSTPLPYHIQHCTVMKNVFFTSLIYIIKL
jgi:hypothetical protein